MGCIDMHRVWKENPVPIGQMTPQRRDAYLRAIFFYANEGMLLLRISKKMHITKSVVSQTIHGKAYRERVKKLGLVLSSTTAVCRMKINPKIVHNHLHDYYLKVVCDVVNDNDTLYEAEEAAELLSDNVHMQKIYNACVIHLWDIKMEINKIMEDVTEDYINKRRALKNIRLKNKEVVSCLK